MDVAVAEAYFRLSLADPIFLGSVSLELDSRLCDSENLSEAHTLKTEVQPGKSGSPPADSATAGSDVDGVADEKSTEKIPSVDDPLLQAALRLEADAGRIETWICEQTGVKCKFLANQNEISPGTIGGTSIRPITIDKSFVRKALVRITELLEQALTRRRLAFGLAFGSGSRSVSRDFSSAIRAYIAFCSFWARQLGQRQSLNSPRRDGKKFNEEDTDNDNSDTIGDGGNDSRNANESSPSIHENKSYAAESTVYDIRAYNRKRYFVGGVGDKGSPENKNSQNNASLKTQTQNSEHLKRHPRIAASANADFHDIHSRSQPQGPTHFQPKWLLRPTTANVVLSRNNIIRSPDSTATSTQNTILIRNKVGSRLRADPLQDLHPALLFSPMLQKSSEFTSETNELRKFAGKLNSKTIVASGVKEDLGFAVPVPLASVPPMALPPAVGDDDGDDVERDNATFISNDESGNGLQDSSHSDRCLVQINNTIDLPTNDLIFVLLSKVEEAFRKYGRMLLVADEHDDGDTVSVRNEIATQHSNSGSELEMGSPRRQPPQEHFRSPLDRSPRNPKPMSMVLASPLNNDENSSLSPQHAFSPACRSQQHSRQHSRSPTANRTTSVDFT
jgi:hypothetical protein